LPAKGRPGHFDDVPLCKKSFTDNFCTMKKNLTVTLMILLSWSCSIAQPVPPDSLYFGQTPPGDIPQVFAPGLVSLPGRREATITFSPDGATVFFHIQFYPQPGTPYIMYSTYAGNHWTTPATIPFSVGRAAAEPFFAYNGTRVYMYATNAVNHAGIADLSYSEKQGAGWSNPVSMGNPPNSEAWQYHPCIVGDTSVYFSSNAGDVCRCQYDNGAYQARVILPVPVNHVGAQTWGDPFVAPDESYMILKSIRPEGLGQNDLYITYRKSDATWTNPKNLGNVINTPGDEMAGDITPDGLYMTYGRGDDLYWVSTGFIDSLRYTNFLPYVKNPVPDQAAVKGVPFTFTIPDSTFIDDDGNNTLTFHAILANGSPLPGWLSFDTVTATFTGIPPDAETLIIRVTATDTAGAAASTNVKIKVNNPVSTGRTTGKTKDAVIFPNPSGGLFYLASETCAGKDATVEICNPAGKCVLKKPFVNNMCVDLTGSPKGIYILKLADDDGMIVRRVVLCH
jgi:hypothetical protein